MENETIYTVVVYNHIQIKRLMSLIVYKTNSKVVENNNYLTNILGNKIPSFSLPFTEIIEKDKMYYYNYCLGGERAIATNRATPIDALRDAFNCLVKKNQTVLEPHYMSMAIGKIINTLRRMYQEENIASVSFIMMQDQKYLIACQNTDGNRIMVHDDLTY